MRPLDEVRTVQTSAENEREEDGSKESDEKPANAGGKQTDNQPFEDYHRKWRYDENEPMEIAEKSLQ